MRVKLPFLFECDEVRQSRVIRERSLRSSVEVEIPELGIQEIDLALLYPIGDRFFEIHSISGSLAVPLRLPSGAFIPAASFQGVIERILGTLHEEQPLCDFPAPPYLRAPRWDGFCALNYRQPMGLAGHRAAVEDLHDLRHRQAKAFFERTLFVVGTKVWAAVREPVLSLRLWATRVGVSLIRRPVVGAAHRQFSMGRSGDIMDFVHHSLHRQCGLDPDFSMLDPDAFKQCDLVELAWDTLRNWGHPELDRHLLLEGPPQPGTVDARVLVRIAHKRLVESAALENAGRLDAHRLAPKFLRRWEFELSFPHAQEMMTGDLVPSWTANEVPQDILDELATLSL
jgi:hypothetical protein